MHGTMTTEHTVWCATCAAWYQVPCETKKESAIEAEIKGWVKDKKIGWICPECQKVKAKEVNS